MKEQLINWLNNDSEEFQFILFISLLILLIVIEFIIPFRKQRINRRERWLTNFLITLLNIVLLSLLPVTFISAAFYVEKESLGLLYQVSLPFIPLIILSLLLRGFISFITHYLMHKIPLLWRLHRVHHLDTELDISTTVRFHPFEFVLNLLIGIPLITLFGLSPWALFFYELFDVAITLVSHSNISFPLSVEKLLRYIVVTPNLHRVHHSSFQEETDSNYSAVFPIWDIIFKTFRTKTKRVQQEMELGLMEVRDKRTNNLLWLLISPFIPFKKFTGNKSIIPEQMKN